MGMPEASAGRNRKKNLPRPPYKILVVSRGSQLKRIGAKALLEFINPIVEERAYITLQKKVTLKYEKKWLKESAAPALDNGSVVKLYLFIDGEIAGNCDIRKAVVQGEEGNVSFGLAVSKKFRGFGFGELLLMKGIAVAKKKFKPHRIWVDFVDGNPVAPRLYKKAGFVEVARLNEYYRHYGKWHDKVTMEYVGK